MKMLERLQKKEASLAVVGLGYVGLPLAVAFGEKFKTIGFDINERKITLYREGLDPTHEVGNQLVKDSAVEFTADPAALRRAAFIIIAVPTPIHADKTPDLLPLLSACRLVGENLSPGSIVVFESTVYPGVTEEICLPLIEKTCGLQCGTAFSAGYSPERINPGDQEHRLENIKKLMSLQGSALTVMIDGKNAVTQLPVTRQSGGLLIEAGWSGYGWNQRNLTDDVYDGLFEQLIVTDNRSGKEETLYDGRLHGFDAAVFWCRERWNHLVSWFIQYL